MRTIFLKAMQLTIQLFQVSTLYESAMNVRKTLFIAYDTLYKLTTPILLYKFFFSRLIENGNP